MVVHDIHTKRICVQAYLTYISTIDEQIRELEIRIRDIRQRLDLMGVSFDGDSVTTTGGDRIADTVARIIDSEQEWCDRINLYHDEIQRVRDWCMPCHVGRWAMWLYTVERRSWAYVARIIGYSVRHTKRLADKGACELYELIPEQWRRDAIPNAMPQ